MRNRATDTRTGHLDAGRRAGVTFQGWYAGTANHNFVTLQMIEAAAWDDDRRAADPLRNPKIEEFDFGKLVAQFDQARAVNPVLDRWSLMNGLLSAHLSGSDSAALGGDLAYRYAETGALTGMGLASAQTVLKDPQFGNQAQALQPLASLQDGPGRHS